MSIENSQCERCVETCSAYQRCFLAYTEAGVQREVRFSGCAEGEIPRELGRVFRECEGLGTVSGLDFVARVRSANRWVVLRYWRFGGGINIDSEDAAST